MTNYYPKEPISPYIFRTADLRDATYRPKLSDVRKLQDAFDTMRDMKRTIQEQRDESDAENDRLRDEVERLKELLAADGVAA